MKKTVNDIIPLGDKAASPAFVSGSMLESPDDNVIKVQSQKDMSLAKRRAEDLIVLNKKQLKVESSSPGKPKRSDSQNTSATAAKTS